MNHPARPLEDELRRIAAAGFDFVDLTLEPPAAWPVDASRVRRLLDELGVAAVGHTAWSLPIASPFHELRERALELVRASLDVFAELGVARVNLHPDSSVRLLSHEEIVGRNV